MKNFLTVVAFLTVATLALAAAPPPISDVLFAQVPKADGLHLGKPGTDARNAVVIDGLLNIPNTSVGGTCTLNGASPSVCTATVRSGARCVCNINGGSAAIAAAGVACAVSSTTLTATSANAGNQVVSYICF